MSTPQRHVAAAALRECLRVQRAHVDVIGGIRTGIVLIALITVGYQVGLLAESLSLGIGALFASISDAADSPGRRLRAMAWGVLWSAAGTLVGGLVSGMDILHIVAGFAVALVCGYASALGPRGALIGTLTLVLFAVFGGEITGTGIALLDAGLVIVGGTAYIIVALAAVPLKRLAMARVAVARAYRSYAEATGAATDAGRTRLEMTVPTVATEAMVARTSADHMGVQGATAEWLHGLVRDLERARLALLALLALEGEGEGVAYAEEIARASGRVARQIGDSLVTPFPRDVATPLAQLESLAAQAPTDDLGILAQDVVQPLRDAAGRLRKPWPIGGRADLDPPPIVNPPVMARLRAHVRPGDPIAEHAMRLCLAFGIANLVAVLSQVPHAYWFPMTVAWVTKPDLSGTVTRVFMRVAGTLLGIVVTVAFVILADGTALQAPVSILAIGVATYIAIAYIWANYPVAVIGITTFVLMVEHLGGGNSEVNVLARVGFTILAGLWVLLFAITRPRRSSLTALDALARTTAAIRAYAAVVRDGGDATEARALVCRERLSALTAVAAAATEPKGLWERPGPRMEPEEAAVLLTEALESASVVVAEELLHEHHRDDADLWRRVDADLDDMDARIAALRAG